MLALTVLALVACSSEDTPATPADNAPSSEMAGMASENGSPHVHGSSVEVAEGVPVPTIEIDVSEDRVEGWNLRIITTDFEIVPENVSTAHIDGEGHMHLYIDGEKVSRLYGEWHYISEHTTGAGRHDVRVELSSNNHSALAVNGRIIDATAEIFQDRRTNQSLVRDEPVEAVEPHPSVSARLVDDPAGGWSLHAVPSNFRLAPENASSVHVDGEGHMRLYVDGEQVARLYETWYQMPPLAVGTHEIKVDLRTNDHAPITVNGTPVATTITLEVSEDEATMPDGHDHEASADDTHDHHDHDHEHGSAGEPTRYDADLADAVQTITVDAVGGVPVGGVRRVEADLGSVVALMVTSDTAEEVHVHGYDILRGVSEANPAHFAFTAEIPGVFEVELEGSGRLLLLLQIS